MRINFWLLILVIIILYILANVLIIVAVNIYLKRKSRALKEIEKILASTQEFQHKIQAKIKDIYKL